MNVAKMMAGGTIAVGAILIGFLLLAIGSLIGGAFLLLGMSFLSPSILALLPPAIATIGWVDASAIVFICGLLFKTSSISKGD